MSTYDDIFQQLVKAAYQGNLNDTIAKIRKLGNAEEGKLELLLHPENLTPVVHLKEDNCSCPPDSSPCEVACLFSAIEKDKSGQVRVSSEACVGCARCLNSCRKKMLKDVQSSEMYA